MGNEKKANGYGLRVAQWLGQKSGLLPLKLQRWIAGAAMLGIAIYCGSLIAGGGSGLPDFGTISKPVGMAESRKLHVKLTALVTYLDSLAQTDHGRAKRDSILRMNPGLLDSIVVWKERVQQMDRQ